MVTIAILPGLKRTTTDANEPAGFTGASYLISTTDALQAVGTRRSQLQLPRARPFALAQTSKLTGGHHWFRGAHSIDSICRQRCQLSKASHVVACTSTLYSDYRSFLNSRKSSSSPKKNWATLRYPPNTRNNTRRHHKIGLQKQLDTFTLHCTALQTDQAKIAFTRGKNKTPRKASSRHRPNTWSRWRWGRT